MKNLLNFSLFFCLISLGISSDLVIEKAPAFNLSSVKSVAVIEFRGYPGESKSGDIVQESSIKALKKLGFSVVEKEKVSQILSSLGLQITDEMPSSSISEIANALSVDAVLFGKILDFSSSGTSEGVFHDATPQPGPGSYIPYAEYSYSFKISLKLADSTGRIVLTAENKRSGRARTVNMKEIAEKTIKDIFKKAKGK
ncbi:MAG: hypothetical protein ACUVUG_08840 [Candidatus Aminicenantia bacterium]